MVVFFGPEAHRETYGRQVRRGGYSKDYLQLSKKSEFLDAMANLFGVDRNVTQSVPLTYQWARGTAGGDFVFRSGDRAHLKWVTALGTPQVWRMSPAPSESTHETIPGTPGHTDFDLAQAEHAGLAARGAGQPYLMVIKLRGEARTLHLRAYLEDPNTAYAWADIQLTPQAVQDMASRTTQHRTLQWSPFLSGGVLAGAKVVAALAQLDAAPIPASVIASLDAETGRALAAYLRQPAYGLFFDPTRNHDAWVQPARLSSKITSATTALLAAIDARFPAVPQGDAAAETLEADPDLVASFKAQIDGGNFGVPDATATTKTRGSAQKAFAKVVKANYGQKCAITGIKTKSFLVAAHIVPWSKDQNIRLDPSNGICLSLLVDRAFESGVLIIEDDLTIRIRWDMVGDDEKLKGQLQPFDGKKVTPPTAGAAKAEYLKRRRELVVPPA
ncbi:HNH endonuclease [Limnoglobus roseus]|nr:HNH endonuclease [Limnoglobus roseus]